MLECPEDRRLFFVVFRKCASTSNFPFYIENKFITLAALLYTKFSQSLKNRSMLFISTGGGGTLFMGKGPQMREMILRIMPSGGQKFKFFIFFPNAAE